MKKLTVTSLMDQIPDQDSAYKFLEAKRWPNGRVCPHCGVVGEHYFLTPTGEARKTRTGNPTPRRIWKCSACRKQFSVTTGTVMHGSKVSLRIWIFVIFEMCANKNGIAAREIERKYGVASRTAWFMTHRIREAMAQGNGTLLDGNVVVDEVYIGGDPEFRHGGGKGSGHSDKVPVVTLIDAESREARSIVVPSVDSKSLGDVIRDNVEMATTVLHTDSHKGYVPVGRKMAGHVAVDHKAGVYATDKTHGTNLCENYFAQLKRGLKGTHIHVSPEHLHRYLGEFDFRYSTCKEDDTARMDRLMGMVAHTRLTYRGVVGR